MVNIEIDGKALEAESGAMIIEAADEAGIHIPRFCYHKKLSIAANCRMCLVQVENARKPMPACATPITEGMKVFTHSPMAKESQAAVMEFLLMNHPLDCPICDQGGQCELQDLSMAFGDAHSHFEGKKRVVADHDIGPLVETETTRCIHCTRCVRFGEEIAGIREMGGTDRGEHMKIGTYVEQVLESEMSGNIIDLCPVGALTSKPFRFQARAWELKQHRSIAAHDAVGSHVYIHHRQQNVMRVVPKEAENINESWLSDRDRFAYLGLESSDRLTSPMIKDNGVWREVDWSEALALVGSKMKTLQQQYGGGSFGALIPPNATLEEMYLFQKLWTMVGSPHIDHRLRQLDFSDDLQQPLVPQSPIAIADIENQSAIFLMGSHLAHEQAILAHRVRRAQSQGATLFALNPVAWKLHAPIEHEWLSAPSNLLNHLLEIAKAIAIEKQVDIPALWASTFETVVISARASSIASAWISNKGKRLIMLGAIAQQHPQRASLKSVAEWIATLLPDTRCVELTDGANSAGAWLAGCVPHRDVGGAEKALMGLSARSMFRESLKSYWLWQVEPEVDCAESLVARKALKQAEMVVAFTTFVSDHLRDVADVLLPVAAFGENEGTFVNIEGHEQSFSAAVSPKGHAKVGWKILRVLFDQWLDQCSDKTSQQHDNESDNLLDCRHLHFNDVESVRAAWQSECAVAVLKKNKNVLPLAVSNRIEKNKMVERVMEWPMYRVDPLVRRSEALQVWDRAIVGPVVRMSARTLAGLSLSDISYVNIQQGGEQIRLPLKIDSTIADGCAWIPSGYSETTLLNNSVADIIEIAKG